MNVKEEFFDVICDWYCKEAELSVESLICHLRERFEDGDGIDRILRHFKLTILLDEPVQIQAELVVERIICMNMAKIRLSKKKRCQLPDRHVNWVASKIEHECGEGGLYHSARYSSVLDLTLLGGLKYLINQWQLMHEAIGCHDVPRKNRLCRLNRLLEMTKSIPEQFWNHECSSRLARMDKDAASVVARSTLLYKKSSFIGAELGLRARKFFTDEDVQGGRVNAAIALRNEDNLFEWIVALQIAKIASSDGWKLKRHDSGDRVVNYGSLVLSKDDWCLQIGKGKPRNGLGKLISFNDPREALLARHGCGSSGYEPDVVLSFYKKSTPHLVRIFVADAKHGGDSYLREAVTKAAAYLYAFGEILPNNPKCTLIFSGINDYRFITKMNQSSGVDVEVNFPDIMCVNYPAFNPDKDANLEADRQLFVEWFRHLTTLACHN